jgi:Rrf2 family nitric oxide-sensitive transcriptional repressor
MYFECYPSVMRHVRSMQLTRFTDYALRVLIHLGSRPEAFATVAALADDQGISRHHLTKVVHQLGVKGYIATVRGKGGGFRLARQAETIRIGDVVRDLETNFELAECFRAGASACRLLPACALKSALAEAGHAFLASLDAHTLADLLPAARPPTVMRRVARSAAGKGSVRS